VENISARDKCEMKYKQQIRETDNDNKFVIFLEVKIVIYISKMFRPTIFFLCCASQTRDVQIFDLAPDPQVTLCHVHGRYVE